MRRFLKTHYGSIRFEDDVGQGSKSVLFVEAFEPDVVGQNSQVRKFLDYRKWLKQPFFELFNAWVELVLKFAVTFHFSELLRFRADREELVCEQASLH